MDKAIIRIEKVDLDRNFRDLQKNFVEQTKSDLKIVLEPFGQQSKDLQSKITGLGKEITRLVDTDFRKLFLELQKVFITQTKEDLKVELEKFDQKSKDLQTNIADLKAQVKRLEDIDLEKHFNTLQKTLSDVFGSINTINLTLLGIVKSLGTIQSDIDDNHKEVTKSLENFKESIESHLVKQDEQAKNNVALLESKIKLLSEQNGLIKKEIETGRIIQIVGFVVIIFVLLYIAVK